MSRKIVFILLNFVIAATASAKKFADCSTTTEKDTECVTTLSNLHPGQPDVGLYVINMTTPEKGTVEKFAKECKKDNNDLKDDLKERGSSEAGIAGVIDQSGIVYLVNGHHHAYALQELEKSSDNKCGYDGRIYVYIVANKSNLNSDQFRQYMLENNLVWLHDSTGKDISYNSLPAKLHGMGNNPYRSVIKLVEDSKCNEKNPIIDLANTTPYLEFIWADRLYKYNQSFTQIDSENAADYAVDSYNYIVENFDKFKDLPGAMVPENKKMCTSF